MYLSLKQKLSSSDFNELTYGWSNKIRKEEDWNNIFNLKKRLIASLFFLFFQKFILMLKKCKYCLFYKFVINTLF